MVFAIVILSIISLVMISLFVSEIAAKKNIEKAWEHDKGKIRELQIVDKERCEVHNALIDATHEQRESYAGLLRDKKRAYDDNERFLEDLKNMGNVNDALRIELDHANGLRARILKLATDAIEGKEGEDYETMFNRLNELHIELIKDFSGLEDRDEAKRSKLKSIHQIATDALNGVIDPVVDSIGMTGDELMRRVKEQDKAIAATFDKSSNSPLCGVGLLPNVPPCITP